MSNKKENHEYLCLKTIENRNALYIIVRKYRKIKTEELNYGGWLFRFYEEENISRFDYKNLENYYKKIFKIKFHLII